MPTKYKIPDFGKSGSRGNKKKYLELGEFECDIKGFGMIKKD